MTFSSAFRVVTRVSSNRTTANIFSTWLTSSVQSKIIEKHLAMVAFAHFFLYNWPEAVFIRSEFPFPDSEPSLL